MQEPFINASDILQRNQEILEEIKSSNDILRICELMNESKAIREIAYERCDKLNDRGMLELCRKYADNNYKKIMIAATYRVNMIKKKQQREQNRVYMGQT